METMCAPSVTHGRYHVCLDKVFLCLPVHLLDNTKHSPECPQVYKLSVQSLDKMNQAVRHVSWNKVLCTSVHTLSSWIVITLCCTAWSSGGGATFVPSTLTWLFCCRAWIQYIAGYNNSRTKCNKTMLVCNARLSKMMKDNHCIWTKHFMMF